MKVLFINDPLIKTGSYIDTPHIIKNKQAIIDVQNTNDNECFKWSILAALYPVESKQHPNRVSKYKSQ